jgi:hypothetical protein
VRTERDNNGSACLTIVSVGIAVKARTFGGPLMWWLTITGYIQLISIIESLWVWVWVWVWCVLCVHVLCVQAGTLAKLATHTLGVLKVRVTSCVLKCALPICAAQGTSSRALTLPLLPK